MRLVTSARCFAKYAMLLAIVLSADLFAEDELVSRQWLMPNGSTIELRTAISEVPKEISVPKGILQTKDDVLEKLGIYVKTKDAKEWTSVWRYEIIHNPKNAYLES